MNPIYCHEKHGYSSTGLSAIIARVVRAACWGGQAGRGIWMGRFMPPSQVYASLAPLVPTKGPQRCRKTGVWRGGDGCRWLWPHNIRDVGSTETGHSVGKVWLPSFIFLQDSFLRRRIDCRVVYLSLKPIFH